MRFQLTELIDDDYRVADNALDKFRKSGRFSNPQEYVKKYQGLSDDEYKNMKKASLPDSASEEERKAYFNYIDNSSDALSVVLTIAKKFGVEVKGLDARVKEGDSYLRKVKDRNTPFIEDCVRFTLICTNANLVKIYQLVTKQMEQSGYSVHMIENNFTDDKIALNNLAVYYEKNNALVEIWFHTDETFAALKKGHKYYEVLRSYDGDNPEEVKALLNVLNDIYNTSMPSNITSIVSTGTFLHEDAELTDEDMPFDIQATLDVIKRAWRAIQ